MSNRTPQYRRYRKVYARVKLNGVWLHLGKYDSPEAKAKYRQLITQWAVNCPPEPAVDPDTFSVAELLAGYLDHAEAYYGHDSNHLGYVKRLIATVRELFADLPAAEFGPRKLKTVRSAFVAKGWVRSKINEAVRDVVAMFSWAVEQEMIPGSLVHTLREVRSLRFGRCDVRESQPVRPVTHELIDATLPHLAPVLADMVLLQLASACRPGELCSLTPDQVDRSGDVWLYRPAQHKTLHHGHDRVIALGPKAQDILRKYLLRPGDAPCFSPREALAQHLERKHERRDTPMNEGNKPRPGRRARAIAKVGDQYTVAAYRRAIERACDRAFPVPEELTGKAKRTWQHEHRWTPHRLRHTAGTTVREMFGLDGAQAILGHKNARVTEVYSELNTAKAIEIARKLG
jgi:integrase